jgi:D-alanyl-D-alanine carboxypeptidase
MTGCVRALLSRAALQALIVVTVASSAAFAAADSSPQQYAARAATPSVLQETLDAAREKSGAPGAQATIFLNGQLIWAGTSGVAGLDGSEPVTASTLFSLASVTKTYTAVLTLRLVEDGQLGLDDRVGRWLGRRVRSGVGATTVRQLLGMTSGLPDYTEAPQLARAFEDPNHRWSERELLRAIGPPRRAGRYLYSNSNYILLGAIDARAGGERVGALLARMILEPLQISDTFLDRAKPEAARFAHGYELLANGRLTDTFAGARSVPTSLWGPAFTDGGIAATATAVGRFLDSLYMGRLLAPQTLMAMLTPGPDGSYGMGTFRFEFDGHMFQGHDGAFGGFSSDAFTDIARGVTIVVLANGMTRRGNADPADAIWTALAKVFDEGAG